MSMEISSNYKDYNERKSMIEQWSLLLPEM